MSGDQIYTNLVFNSNSELWNEYDLPRLRLLQLRTLAQLLGAPYSGTKAKLVVRILAIRQVRIKLAPFAADEAGLAALVSAFRKEALKHMARECGLWRSGNKGQLASVLLSWRERVRASGKKLFNRIVTASQAQDRQLEMKIAA